MSKRYSGKSFKDSSLKKKPKLTLKEKRKLKKEKKKIYKILILVWFVVCIIFAFVQFIAGDTGHALEVFALISAIALFFLSRIKDKIK